MNIEPRIEEQAELVLGRLGIPVSVAVNMFLKQVVIQKRIPFEVTLSTNYPIDTSTLNDEELDIEIEKGYAFFYKVIQNM
ncbi:type II toxin-antitoxin system RelB/DinJ family antitoxin [Cerasibacillus quisquiliarum]|uniref:type II toxin-antitoxin system RelB/DinJ family antitoxin n=1 Tax=Cerasibacillus quisquiliarum TaxID=227865 RepID=UPI001C3FB4EB